MKNTDLLGRTEAAARALPQPVRFTIEDAHRAYDEWGANCGPGALAAILGMTLDEVRPLMGDFESKRYTNPSLMFDSLRRAQANWRDVRHPRIPQNNEFLSPDLPAFGLARVQWEGPWTAPGVPIRVRYRHTHWIGSRAVLGQQDALPGDDRQIFDINCMCVGGWVSRAEWAGSVVPWLLKQCEPKANGGWHLTHVVEVQRVAGQHGADASTAALPGASSGPDQHGSAQRKG